MTVLEVIQKSSDFLAKKGVEMSRLQTELLLAHLLKMPRMNLYLNFDRSLSSVELDAFRDLVKRRGQREPLQHIIGSSSFCGMEISVNRHVLVPRPETELLAEAGWQFLTTFKSQPATTLDFGTGSGCIAIAMAAKCPTAQILALEVSGQACAVAHENAVRHGVAERIQFVQGDSFSVLPVDMKFDLIISNPPYIPTAEIRSLQPEVRDYDPHEALDGGVDGLDFYRMFASTGAAFLIPGGKIMLEFGDGQAEAVRSTFETQLWIVEEVKPDYTQRPRILIARRK